jgi:NADH dehydrogenase
LAEHLDENLFEVLIIDKVNHHQFQPLFYQVATSQIEPSSISFPIRNVLKNKKNVQVRLAEVNFIDNQKNQIHTSIGNFNYDELVLAMGCTTNFFGNQNIAKHAFTLKSTYEAITIRNHILQTFEDVISANDNNKQSLLNLVIVGAGPTGVELAGSFAEMKTHILPKDYPNIDFSKFTIYLIEGSKHTLNNMSEKSKIDSEKYLKHLGVTIITEAFVKDYDGTNLLLSNGNTFQTKTVIWAAGVTANKIEGLDEKSITFGGRLKVDRYNKVS